MTRQAPLEGRPEQGESLPPDGSPHPSEYPSDFMQRTHTGEEIAAQGEALMGQAVVINGRVEAVRSHRKVEFFDVSDMTGTTQVMRQVDDASVDEQARVGRGDIVAVSGVVAQSRTGQTSVAADRTQILARSQTAPPAPGSSRGPGYVDVMTQPEVRQTLLRRSRIVAYVREHLGRIGMVEIETPVLSPTYNGGVAEPFVTRSRERGGDMYLRVTAELQLKRMIIAGIEGVFSIAKNFRNEGFGKNYSPEFTALELYRAYSTDRWAMGQVEEMVGHVAAEFHGDRPIQWRGHEIRGLGGEWRRIAFDDAITEALGAKNPYEYEAALRAAGARYGIDPVQDRTRLLATIYRAQVESSLVSPTFVTDFPVTMVPLAKRSEDDPGRVQAFRGYVGGLQLCDGNYEENDPAMQRSAMEAQAAEHERLGLPKRPRDEEFMRALLLGMPPTAGLAIGIDRFTMMMTGQDHIRGVLHLRES